MWSGGIAIAAALADGGGGGVGAISNNTIKACIVTR